MYQRTNHLEGLPGKSCLRHKPRKIRHRPAEITIFGLHKFVHLAFNCNPNIIEHLFVDPTHILHCDDYGRQLLDNRHLFLSKKARHTFGGYAIAQLRKLHNKLPMEEAREKLATLEQNKRGYLARIIKLEHRINAMKGSGLTDDEALLILGIETEMRDYTHRVATLEEKIKELPAGSAVETTIPMTATRPSSGNSVTIQSTPPI